MLNKQSIDFQAITEELGYQSNGFLRSTENIEAPNYDNLTEISEWLALEKARQLEVHYVYFRRFETRPSVVQFYIFDFENKQNPSSQKLGEHHRNIWTSGDVSITFVFTKEKIDIWNTAKEPTNNNQSLSPTFLLENIKQIDEELKARFNALNFNTGIFWENNTEDFKFDFSAHYKLLAKLKDVRKKLYEAPWFKNPSVEIDSKQKHFVLNRLLMQCILIRHLEQRKEVDAEGKTIHSVFPNDYFKQFGEAETFEDTLRNKYFIEVFKDLNREERFNGKVFEWRNEYELFLQSIDTEQFIRLFYQTNTEINQQGSFWDLYSFRYMPVETISSIYEELFSDEKEDETGKEKKQKDGMVYTPAHLAAFLVDECMPLHEPKSDFKILDPACGSGVFLVLAFRRLVQWWRINNKGAKPTAKQLNEILSTNIYGVDINEGAIELSVFSLTLALCELLSPYQIWEDLHLTPLKGKNLIHNDFFKWTGSEYGQLFINEKHRNFDLIIGNPPFINAEEETKAAAKGRERGGDIHIPNNQIALRFLDESIKYMSKDEGLICLIVKASPFLYSQESMNINFRRHIFSRSTVCQIIDFTPYFYSNQQFWSVGGVDTCAVFVQKKQPTENYSLLHLIARCYGSATSSRFFEIDTYDFNWVRMNEALQSNGNKNTWKCNLLGGGRLPYIINGIKGITLGEYLEDKEKNHDWYYGVGYQIGKKAKHYQKPKHIFEKPYLPTKWLTTNGIEKNGDFPIETAEDFNKERKELLFTPPHFLLRLVITEDMIPCDISFEYLTHKESILGIHAPIEEKEELMQVYDFFKKNHKLIATYFMLTSGKAYLYRGNALQASDIYNLPFHLDKLELSNIEQYCFDDVANYYIGFLTQAEKSKILHKIPKNELSTLLESFSEIFCSILNSVYKDNEKRFRRGETKLGVNNDFILISFHYDNKPSESTIIENIQLEVNLNKLLLHKKEVAFYNRIMVIYEKNTVHFLKPNKYRYWLNSIAVRDADRVFADMVASGY